MDINNISKIIYSYKNRDNDFLYDVFFKNSSKVAVLKIKDNLGIMLYGQEAMLLSDDEFKIISKMLPKPKKFFQKSGFIYATSGVFVFGFFWVGHIIYQNNNKNNKNIALSTVNDQTPENQVVQLIKEKKPVPNFLIKKISNNVSPNVLASIETYNNSIKKIQNRIKNEPGNIVGSKVTYDQYGISQLPAVNSFAYLTLDKAKLPSTTNLQNINEIKVFGLNP